MTNSEGTIALQKQFDEALSNLGSAIAAVTAMKQTVDLDEATRASAMSVVIDALNKAFDALNLTVSRFRKEAWQTFRKTADGGLSQGGKRPAPQLVRHRAGHAELAASAAGGR